MTVDIELTLDVLHWLAGVADARNREKPPERSRHKDPRYTDLGADYLGVKGEYVTSKVYDVPFDSTGYGRSGDAGVDIYTPTPGAIKTNHRTGGYLLIERWSDLSRVEIVHLVDGPCDPPRRCGCEVIPATEAETWRYVGWMTVADFKAQAEFADWGLGPRRFCRQKCLTQDLHPDAMLI